MDELTWHTIGLRFWEFEGCTAGLASCHQTRFEAGVWRNNTNPSQWFYAWQWQSRHDFHEAGTIAEADLTHWTTDYSPEIPYLHTDLTPTVCNDPLSPCTGSHTQTDMVRYDGLVVSDQYWLITLDNMFPIGIDLSILFANGSEGEAALQLVRTGRVPEPPAILLLIAGSATLMLRVRARGRGRRRSPA